MKTDENRMNKECRMNEAWDTTVVSLVGSDVRARERERHNTINGRSRPSQDLHCGPARAPPKARMPRSAIARPCPSCTSCRSICSSSFSFTGILSTLCCCEDEEEDDFFLIASSRCVVKKHGVGGFGPESASSSP